MIHFTAYLDNEHWRISVYIMEDCSDGGEVIEAMADAGCRGSELADVTGEMRRCGRNIGVTYSSSKQRNSVLVVGMQDDMSEFVNTMRHEQHHVIAHICDCDRIDMFGEEAAYIAGDVGQAVYDGLSLYGIIKKGRRFSPKQINY